MTARNKRSVCAALAIAWGVTGCQPTQGTVLGKITPGEPQTIQSIKTNHPTAPVTLQGVMVEKCPVAGCWFRLQDGTGVIKVDTKSAGFVVVNVPLQTRMSVVGTVVADGSETEVEATGLRY